MSWLRFIITAPTTRPTAKQINSFALKPRN